MKRFILLSFIVLCSVSVYGQQHMQYATSSIGITIESKDIIKREIASPDKFQQQVSAGWWVNSSWYTDFYSAVQLNYTAGIRFNHFVYLGLGAGFDIATTNAYQPYVTDDMDHRYSDYADYYVGRPQYGESVHNWEDGCYELPMQRVALPLYINVKAYCSATKVAPYFSGSVGARFSIPKKLMVYQCKANHSYGSHTIGNNIDYYNYDAVTPFFDLAFGIDVKSKNAGSYSFQVGYNTHIFRTAYHYSNNYYYFGSKFCHGVSLTFGYTF